MTAVNSSRRFCDSAIIYGPQAKTQLRRDDGEKDDNSLAKAGRILFNKVLAEAVSTQYRQAFEGRPAAPSQPFNTKTEK